MKRFASAVDEAGDSVFVGFGEFFAAGDSLPVFVVCGPFDLEQTGIKNLFGVDLSA